eukprot:3509666-Alexandrium_andersonii.AAC.1
MTRRTRHRGAPRTPQPKIRSRASLGDTVKAHTPGTIRGVEANQRLGLGGHRRGRGGEEKG